MSRRGLKYAADIELEAGATLLVRPFLSLKSEVVVRCIALSATFGVIVLEKSVKRCCLPPWEPILEMLPALMLLLAFLFVKVHLWSFKMVYTKNSN